MPYSWSCCGACSSSCKACCHAHHAVQHTLLPVRHQQRLHRRCRYLERGIGLVAGGHRWWADYGWCHRCCCHGWWHHWWHHHWCPPNGGCWSPRLLHVQGWWYGWRPWLQRWLWWEVVGCSGITFSPLWVGCHVLKGLWSLIHVSVCCMSIWMVREGQWSSSPCCCPT